MLSMCLAFCLSFLPQDTGKQSVPPSPDVSESLPLASTLAAVEVAPPSVLIEDAADLPWLGILRHPKFVGAFDYLVGQSRSRDPWYPLWRQRAEWTAWLDRFESGVAGAFVFSKAETSRPNPRTYFVGAARQSGTTREFVDFLGSYVAKRRQELDYEPLVKRGVQLGDQPVMATVFERIRDQDTNWRTRNSLHVMRKGRRVALRTLSTWSRGKDERFKKIDGAVTATLGELVSRRKQPSVMKLGESTSATRALMRGVVRMRQHLRSEEHGVRERDLAETKGLGVWDWEGVTAVLERTPAGLRETLDSYDKAVEGDSLFRALRPGDKRLRDVAALLPADTMAVMRLAFDGEVTSRWLANVSEVARSQGDFALFASTMRNILGLGQAEPAKSYAEFGEVSIAWLAPATGVVAPEPCLFLRVDAAPRDVIDRLVQLFRDMTGRELATKSLGRGEGAIPYMSLLDALIEPRRRRRVDETTMLIKAVFGGGFVSATRAGPYLVVGCNPRSVRRIGREVAAGRTLAAQPDFARAFGGERVAEEPRFFEAWFDWKRAAASFEAFDQLLRAWFLGLALNTRRGQKLNLVVPSTIDLAGLLGEQRIVGTETSFGHRFVFEGSLVVSPLSIGALAFFHDFSEQLALMTRR